MDNLPSKDPVEPKVNLPISGKLPWENQPGWREPERIGVEVDRTLGDKTGERAIGLKVYIADEVDFIGLSCFLGEGTHAQLYTEDDPPKVYELHAPETNLILSTWPRVFESSMITACHWKIRVLAGNRIWFQVDSWHWDEELLRLRRERVRPPVPPLVEKIYDDFSALLQLEQRADKIARRWESPIFSEWTDEEFERHLRLDHPLPNRTPEEIKALLESAPIIRQKMQALKTRAGRRSLGLER